MDLPADLYKALLVAIVGINLFSVPAFIKLLHEDSVRLAVYLLVATIGVSIFAALFAGFVYWFLSAILLCLSPIVAFVSFSILVTKRHNSYQVFKGNRLRGRLYLIGGLLIVVMQLSPLVGFFAIDSICDAVTRERSEDIIAALESYRQGHGSYPEAVETLVPYLSRLPSPACGGRDFSLVHCSTGRTLLTFYSVNGLGIKRYHLETGNWSSIDALDFGVCDSLE